MRIFLTCLLTFIVTLLFSVQPAFTQDVFDKTVKKYYNNQPLSIIIIGWQIDYGVKFEFDREEIEGVFITSKIPRSTLREAIQYLLKNTDLDYELLPPKSIRLFPKDPDAPVPGDVMIPASDMIPSRENITVTGTVKDQDSGESLPYATLQVVGANIGSNTNVDGYFSLFRVPSDTCLIKLSYLGYKSTYVRLTPDTDLEHLELGMEPIGNQLAAVEILADREDQMMKASTGISQISVSPAQLINIPSLGQRDIFRSLQLLPGVSGSNESSSGLYVRGGTPDQNLVLFDGFTVYHVDHLFGFFSAFNSDAIKDVQLYKGGFEAKYGGRLSSVVDITGKDGNSEAFDIDASISLLNTSLTIEIPYADGAGTLLIAGRRSFQSNLYNRILNLSDGGETGTEEETTITDPVQPLGLRGVTNVEPTSWFYDLNVKSTYTSGDNIFSGSIYNGQDELDNGRDADENAFGGGRFGGGNTNFSFQQSVVDESNWGNTGTSFGWSRRWTDRLYSNLMASSSNYFSNRDQGRDLTITREDTTIRRNASTGEYNNLWDFSLRNDWEWQLNHKHQVKGGLSASYLDIQYDFLQNDTTAVLSRDDQGFLGAAYLQTQSTFFDQILVRPGIRMSYYSPTGQPYVEPRLQLQWFPTDRLKVKAAAGRYYQFANRIIREDVTQGSRDFWVLSDGNSVPIGRSDQLILGVSYETADYLFDAEAYYKQLDDITEYSTRFVLNGFGRNSTLEYEENFYNGEGLAQGVELLAQKKSGRLTGWVSYTLGQVRHQFDVYGDEPFAASHDVTHEGKIVGVYQWGRFSVGGTFIYATGRPYTAPIGAYTVELLDGETTSHFAVSDKNALRLPAYHRLDFSANYTIPYFMGGNAKVGLSLFNVYNRSNIWYKEFDVIDGTILETNVNFLGFTPSVFFNWNLR